MLDILVQRRRDKTAAKKFFRKLLKGLTYVPRVMVTDKLKSYAAAKQEMLPSVEHRQHRYLNNRAENSHQPTRQRERTMRASNRQATRNASSRHMIPSCHTFAPNVMALGPEIIARRWPADGTSGGRSRLQRLLRKRKSGGDSPSVSLCSPWHCLI